MQHEVSFRKREAGETVLRQIVVDDGATLLEAAREAGLPMAQACGAHAICARCGVQLIEGGERLSPASELEERSKARNDVPADWRLACQARIHGPAVATTTYW